MLPRRWTSRNVSLQFQLLIFNVFEHHHEPTRSVGLTHGTVEYTTGKPGVQSRSKPPTNTTVHLSLLLLLYYLVFIKGMQCFSLSLGCEISRTFYNTLYLMNLAHFSGSLGL